ncbi:MAG TPA: nitroreductase/quinone reductase family protein [Candidatus Limnocylindria bacterium]|jgi:deazaflavin-dependent oxidoreductase (nitroreductase family)|nr:nitroreductase/quinone reductase family protein [Candidatus Limnocylindria bacterium]
MANARPGGWNDSIIEHFRANAGQMKTGPFAGRSLLLLTTKGAKTGQARTSPVVYSRDGDKLVIIASKGGAPTHPGWYHNLRANPEVTVEQGAEKFRARAQVVEDPVERRRLYDQHAVPMPQFLGYEQKTTRRIPVVLLERI